MNELKLDIGNATTLKISNDAYYYFAEGEDPLDESSFDEIAEISAMFEFGFEIDETKNPIVDNKSGMVEITIIPYTTQMPSSNNEIDESQYDGVIQDKRGTHPWQYYFKFIGINVVKITQINKSLRRKFDSYIGEIVWFYKKPWIKYKIKTEFRNYSFLPFLASNTTIFDNDNISEYMIQQ